MPLIISFFVIFLIIEEPNDFWSFLLLGLNSVDSKRPLQGFSQPPNDAFSSIHFYVLLITCVRQQQNCFHAAIRRFRYTRHIIAPNSAMNLSDTTASSVIMYFDILCVYFLEYLLSSPVIKASLSLKRRSSPSKT